MTTAKCTKMELFKAEIIYTITNEIHSENDELDEIDRLRIGDVFMIDTGYFNLLIDPIAQINPKCVIGRGKTNRKYISQIVFQSGSVSYMIGKPDALIEQFNKYNKYLMDYLNTNNQN